MKLRNKVFFWLLLIFIILNVIDGITALKILPGEANPIYLLTGSITLLYIMKFVLIVGMIYFYRKNTYPTHFSYFFFIMILVYGIMLMVGGIAANSYGMSNPDYVEEVKDVPKQEKLNEYATLTTFIYFIPMGLSLLGFKLYEWSIGSVVIFKPKKKKPWWKFW